MNLNSKLFSYSFVSIFIVQNINTFFNLLFTLIFANTLNSNEFRYFIITETILIFLSLIVQYSFEFDGLRLFINYSDNNKIKSISYLFSMILSCKLFLFFTSTIFLLIASFIFSEYYLFYLFLVGSLIPFSTIFQSNWFLLALKDFKILSFCLIVSRLLALFIILYFSEFITKVFDIYLIIGFCYFISSACIFINIVLRYKLRLKIFNYSRIITILVSRKNIFLSSIFSFLAADISAYLLGYTNASSTDIASYALAQKLIKFVQAFLRPLNYISSKNLILDYSLFKNIPSYFIYLPFKKMRSQILFLISFFIAFCVFFYFLIFLDIEYISNDVFWSFIVMFPALYFGVINYLTGYVSLNIFNYSSYFMIALMLSSLFNFLIFKLYFSSSILFPSILYLLTELFLFVILLLTVFFLHRKHRIEKSFTV